MWSHLAANWDQVWRRRPALAAAGAGECCGDGWQRPLSCLTSRAPPRWAALWGGTTRSTMGASPPPPPLPALVLPLPVSLLYSLNPRAL